MYRRAVLSSPDVARTIDGRSGGKHAPETIFRLMKRVAITAHRARRSSGTYLKVSILTPRPECIPSVLTT